MRSKLLHVFEDSSLCDPDDMWGNEGCGAQENPASPWYPKDVHSGLKLDDLIGIALSHNQKTRICFSEWFDSCHKTAWCRDNCYGNGVRIRVSARRLLEDNFAIMQALAEAPQELVDHAADLIVFTCHYYDCANIRWHGVGDLHQGSNRVAVSIAQRHPEFTVWGFTRKAAELLSLPVLPNLVFWGSIDRTMSEHRVTSLCEAVREHGTGLSYATEVGDYYSPRRAKTPDVPGVKSRTVPTEVQVQEEHDFAEYLEQTATAYDVAVEVAFGYHGEGRTTRLNYQCECPATDPLGKGHYYAACQDCRWCMLKNKPARTLREHARKAL